MKKLLFINSTGSRFLSVFIISVLLFSCQKDHLKPPKANEESADVVYAWYKFVARMQLRVNPQPVVLLIYRNFGYIGVGLYESVRPGIKGSQSLSSFLYQMPPMPTTEMNKDYLWSASANAYLAASFRQFLTGLTDINRASIDSMEAAMNNRFRMSTSEAIISRSQTYGRAVASAIYNWSTSDNFNLASTGYTPPVFPGAWVPTPPAFAAPIGPFLKDSRPFLAYTLTAIDPPPPFPYSENPTSEFYKAVKDVYDVSKTLTAVQKAAADWWADLGGPGVGVPAPYHALHLVTNVLESQGAKLGRAAEVYAKTGIGLKDGPIIVWRDKFTYNLIRPVTYIQRLIDPTWQSYLPTPPYPEYTSGIMSIFGPLTQVLIREFGDIPVTDDAYAWRGLPARHFASLSALAEDVALSRVYGGLHYRFTQYISIDMGKRLGDRIAGINLVPLKY